MDVERYIEVLDGKGPLDRFERDELRVIIEACEELLLQPKQPLWTPDTQRSHAYILVEGTIERTTRTHSERITQQYANVGSMFSLSALVKPWSYHSSAHATERAVVLALSRAAFIELFEEREVAAYKLVDAIGEYLVADMRKANERLQDVFGRPAETLMMLRRRIREDSKA